MRYPPTMSERAHYDLIVLGGGPGGYAAAIRAGQLGLQVALIEKEAVGGTCLHHGCIPSKALLESANVLATIQRAADFGISVGEVRVDFPFIIKRSEKIVNRLSRGLTQLMKNNKVTIYPCPGRFLSNREIELLGMGGEGPQVLEGDRILLATGSRTQSWPELPSDGKRILTSDEALRLSHLPRSMVIIGGGAIGVEFAHLYATFGVAVMIMEQSTELLPTEDQEVSALLKRSFEKRGITVLTSTHVTSITDMQKHFVVQIREVDEPIRTDSILVAIGRKPRVDGLDIKKAGVLISEGNRAVIVNEKMQTSQETIFAVGDVTTRPAFAHGAMAQGVYVAETIAGIEREPIALTEIPSVVFCQPEIASVGLTEAQARASGPGIKTTRFPLSINGRAIVMNETEGFIKLVSDSYGQLLGAHLIGPHATELISEIVLAKHLEARGLDIKRAIHPHPTLSEAVMEAGGALFNQAIHF
jgi:dihydrolipoamide dehydrogenase